jgi:hypothetical protein
MNETPVTTLESVALENVALAPPPAGAPAAITPGMLDLFGRPPLLRREDANLYDALFSRIVTTARPRDPFEWILLKDYTDLAWEIFRLRRAKATLVDGGEMHAVLRVLEKIGARTAPGLEWLRNADARSTILKQLADGGMDEDMITAQAVLDGCTRLAALDARIAAAEARRNAALHEVDHHRSGFSSRLRTAPDVIDAETVPVASGDPPPA